MRELDIIAARMCSTNKFWESPVLSSDGSKAYLVRYEATPEGDYQYDYTCTCPAYKHGKSRHCKHIHQVKHERCAYGQDAFWGSPIEMGDKCPECGSDTIVVRVGI